MGANTPTASHQHHHHHSTIAIAIAINRRNFIGILEYVTGAEKSTGKYCLHEPVLHSP